MSYSFKYDDRVDVFEKAKFEPQLEEGEIDPCIEKSVLEEGTTTAKAPLGGGGEYPLVSQYG